MPPSWPTVLMRISPRYRRSLNVNNLFDRTYYTYADNWSVHGAPRNIMTSLKYDF